MIRALFPFRALSAAALMVLASCAAPTGPVGPAPIDYRGDEDGLGDQQLSARATRPAPPIQSPRQPDEDLEPVGASAPIEDRTLTGGALPPEAPPEAPQPRRVAREGEIVVAAGATLYQISELHRVSLRGLIDANALAAPFALTAGQVLKLPPPNTYIVRPGDTLFGIARRHRVQPRSLALLNEMRQPYAIAPGDEIELPGSARDWEASVHPAANAAPSTSAAVVGAGASTGVGAGAEGVTIVADAAPSGPVASRPARSTPRAPTPALIGPAPTFEWPVSGDVVDGFGPKAAGRRNDGLNIAAPEGAIDDDAKNPK